MDPDREFLLIRRAFVTTVICVCLLLLGLFLSSCRSTKETEKAVIEKQMHQDSVALSLHDTVQVVRLKVDSILKHDSIYMHDSVFIHAKGDTIWSERWHTKYIDRVEYRDRVVYRDSVRTLWRDSITIQRDTIPQTVTLTKTVAERYTPLWVKILAAIGAGSILATGVYVFVKLKV